MQNLSPALKQLFIGNLFLIVCCAFYLAWWIIAFKPGQQQVGAHYGRLLIGAFAGGVIAIVLIVKSSFALPKENALFPGWTALILWAALYIILMLISVKFFSRPVTTELFLITGWLALMAQELNTLFGLGKLTHQSLLIYIIIIIAMFITSFICYMQYYKLSQSVSYIVGMVPLISVAVGAGLMCAALYSN